MTTKSVLRPETVKLTDWQSISQALHEFPPPRVKLDEDGDVSRTAWVFRGVGDANLPLAPTIERTALTTALKWPALELELLGDFRSRASLYLSPPPEGKLGWFALMQHYGVPTRLLDFTLSPFVALYFAAKPFGSPSCKETPDFARVWALDSNAIYERSRRSIAQARRAEREQPEIRYRAGISFAPDNFASARDVVKKESETRNRIAEDVFEATGTFRSELKRRGCICVAMPPSSNPRLASQQGLFLFNGIEDVIFEQSLVTMMESPEHEKWCKAFDIPVCRLLEIERRLFQMNIHEQSLFPDIEGLAGLIKQRIRLHLSKDVNACSG